MIPQILIDDYDYPLPDERIAKFPLPVRDSSKLLVNTDGCFRAEQFRNIAAFLPEGALMVFNETKVVPARLFFRRDTGAMIEIFCLEPVEPSDYQLCFATTEKCRFKAIVGNLKRWKGGVLSLAVDECYCHENPAVAELDLKAEMVERVDNTCIVEFSWKGGVPFSKVIELAGNMPIPPYLNRDTQDVDYVRYQTTYARNEGSVAAPTAGLHFTPAVMDDIRAKGISTEYLTLHVGAGTFLPVKSHNVAEHTMHSEPFEVKKSFLQNLSAALDGGAHAAVGEAAAGEASAGEAGAGETAAGSTAKARPVISVGTTSTRTLESLYYIGVHCIELGEPQVVQQWEPYRDEGYSYSAKEAIGAIINYLDANDKDSIIARTSLIILPGFKYRIIDYLVTNFHQPKSTLLLLIAALIGQEWRGMYDFALANGFRFLSYGDSSLLKRK